MMLIMNGVELQRSTNIGKHISKQKELNNEKKLTAKMKREKKTQHQQN